MTSPNPPEAEEYPARSHAEAYERFAVPALFAGWAVSLVELASPVPGARILDVGCGTGIVARTAAAHVGADAFVAAVDNDPAMLEFARDASAGAAAPIRWYEADAYDLPFDGAAFDIVFCQQTLQFLEDPVAALAEMGRVVRPGGSVAIDTWRGVRDKPASHVLAVTFAEHLGPEAARELDVPCALGEPETLGRSVSEAGLDVLHAGVLMQTLHPRSSEDLLDLASLITSFGPWLAELTGEARRRLIDDLDRALVAAGRPIPLEACVAVGRR